MLFLMMLSVNKLKPYTTAVDVTSSFSCKHNELYSLMWSVEERKQIRGLKTNFSSDSQVLVMTSQCLSKARLTTKNY